MERGIFEVGDPTAQFKCISVLIQLVHLDTYCICSFICIYVHSVRTFKVLLITNLHFTHLPQLIIVCFTVQILYFWKRQRKVAHLHFSCPYLFGRLLFGYYFCPNLSDFSLASLISELEHIRTPCQALFPVFASFESIFVHIGSGTNVPAINESKWAVF